MPPIHRTLKNVVKNYSYAEVKVREATSNDPWGPSTSLMAEIAELTFDLAAMIEIMAMIWKRINDHGKNWRHVYKALVLLEHLARFGADGVAVQCRENLVAIKTLQDFQHVEDGKDQGHSVREKAKQLVRLLTDDDKFRAERARANTARSRFGAGYDRSPERNIDSSFGSTPAAGSGSDRYGPQVERYLSSSGGGGVDRSPERQGYNSPAGGVGSSRPTAAPRAQAQPARAAVRTEIDAVRPTSTNEEDAQLEMALAMSRQQHEEEERLRKGDEIKLQMAIEESKKTAQREYLPSSRSHQTATPSSYASSNKPNPAPPAVALTHSLEDPWAAPPVYAQPLSALRGGGTGGGGGGGWEGSAALMKEPWELGATSTNDQRTPAPRQQQKPTSEAAWGGPFPSTTNGGASGFQGGRDDKNGKEFDEFSELSSSRYRDPPQASKNRSIEQWLDNSVRVGEKEPNLWAESDGDDSLDEGGKSLDPNKGGGAQKKVTPEEFLGPHAKLVDFDDLVSKPTPSSVLNPFAITIGKSSPASNPFAVKAQEEERSKRVPLNQLQPTNQGSFSSLGVGGATGGIGIAPGPTIGPASWPAVAVVYTAQPMVPNSSAAGGAGGGVPGYNPFL